MFGWNPRLTIDCFLGLDPGNESDQTHSGYANKLQKRSETVHQMASAESKKIASKNKYRYDAKVKDVKLEVGDRVLVRNVGLKGKNKLADKWDEEVYVILEQRPGLPVYKVKGEVGGRIRTLHRNMLLSYSGFSEGKDMDAPPAKKKKAERKLRSTGAIPDESFQSSSPSSDSEGDELAIWRKIQPKVSKIDFLNNDNVTDNSECLSLQDDDQVPMDESLVMDDGRSLGEDPLSGIDDCAEPKEATEDMSENQTEPMQIEQPQPEYRRSTRCRKPPDRYGEWVE